MLVYHHVGKNMHTWKHKRNFIAHFPSGESCVSQLFYYSLMNLFQTCACSWERTKLIISSLTLSHHVFFGHPMCSSGKNMHYKFQRFAIEDLVKPGLQLWKTSLPFPISMWVLNFIPPFVPEDNLWRQMALEDIFKNTEKNKVAKQKPKVVA